jgi:hypothetical protein
MTGEGRPPAGAPDDVLKVRLSAEVRAAVEAWANRQSDKPNVQEALQRLIEHGLATD